MKRLLSTKRGSIFSSCAAAQRSFSCESTLCCPHDPQAPKAAAGDTLADHPHKEDVSDVKKLLQKQQLQSVLMPRPPRGADISNLLDYNEEWSNSVQEANPTYFSELAKQQNPQYLWIGCADSRVPANQVVGLAPGEVFVHRNIANVVSRADLNCLSCLQFARHWLVRVLALPTTGSCTLRM
ncbi:carbonic anhydrase, putative [Bodo saltans]|uniref:Carbonic anhydrase n=1 Tax=Bodo saltans TaxID=75058 RepID=A0A0S4J3T4_BODSA|nr:carbonic anhydrase, putative [Bodo saltans]|eukprot:CUG71291.1 carbonic anhydrase, putative [Bodo saltans]